MGIRTLLNYGHTIGHAVEGALYPHILHGEAVGFGIIAANDIAKTLKLIDEYDAQRIEMLLKRLSIKYKYNVGVDKVIDFLKQDKKFIHGSIRMVFAKKIGDAVVKENIPLKIIKDALKKRFG